MVSSPVGPTSISNVKLSSVVPATMTREDKAHELTNMDLATKLHYVKGLYFFKNTNGDDNLVHRGLTINDLKKPMFAWLDLYNHVAGRIRRHVEKGRPFIKCNDCGVRIVEAQCDKTVEEVLAMNDHSLHKLLVYNQVLGPDIGLSPLVFLQFTWFKCGGLSVGLSWAHVLGDVSSAATFINMWGNIMAGHAPPESLIIPEFEEPESHSSISEYPIYAKQVVPVGDYWISANNCKMETHSFHLNANQVSQLKKIVHAPAKPLTFEILSAIVWKSLAKIRGLNEPKCVTICLKNSHFKDNEAPSNNQLLSTVEVNFLVGEAEVLDLAELIYERKFNKKGSIEKFMGTEDLIVYGANLTFVDLEKANIYGLKMKGHKLVNANYSIDGVGDEGAVLVLPGKEEGGEGRTLTITLPEKQLAELKIEFKREWDIV